MSTMPLTPHIPLCSIQFNNSVLAGIFNQKNTDEHIANHSMSSPVRDLQYSGEDCIFVATIVLAHINVHSS